MISIVLITFILAIELFYLTQFHSFIGVFFEYLPLFFTVVLLYILDKVEVVQEILAMCIHLYFRKRYR